MTEAYLELGSYYSSKRLWLKLASTMEEALDAGVTSPMIYIRLAQAQIQLNQQDAALENALEGSANDPGLLLGYLVVGQAYVTVGIDTFEASNFTAAVWPLQTYLTYTQEDHRGWAYLGRAWASLGQHDNALSALNYSIQLNDSYAPAYIARSIIYMAQGKLEDALTDLTLGWRYGPETFDLQLLTARAYYLLGENEDALDYVNDALSLANEERLLAKKEVKLGEGYALRALISETNPDPDMQSYALLNWRWVARLTYVRPETLAMAEAHIAELTGQAPSRTPTASPTATPTNTPTSTATPTRTPTSPTSTSRVTWTPLP
jgi:tetratricopeptide (TPR) repeat protein